MITAVHSGVNVAKASPDDAGRLANLHCEVSKTARVMSAHVYSYHLMGCDDSQVTRGNPG